MDETDGRVPTPAPGGSYDAPAGMDPVSEQSASFHHPDVAAVSASQRIRLIPPDGKPIPWWVRHREKLGLLETILTALFFLLTLYFLWLWIFAPPDVEMVFSSDRTGFLLALHALPPARRQPAWQVSAEKGRWKTIVVHHTATDKATPEGIDRYHRETMKFENGLGYHFLIGNGNGMEDGEIVASRRWLEQLDGAHVRMRDQKKGNSFAIGIALAGNFENTIATARQLASLRALLSFLTQEYGIDKEMIVGHGQVSEKHTLCPGELFFLDEVIQSL